MRIQRDRFAEISIVLYICFAFFSDLIGIVLNNNIFIYVLFFIILFLGLASLGFRVPKPSGKTFVSVIIVIAFILIRNQGISNGDYSKTIRLLFYFFYGLLLGQMRVSCMKAIKYLSYIGFIHVIATLFFWAFPSSYRIMYNVWGYWPTGTALGKSGYTAALTHHYSTNGIMLAITYMALFPLAFMNSREKNKNQRGNKKKHLFMFFLAVFATLLTTKRAHVLFGTMAIAIVYYLLYPDKRNTRKFKLLLLLFGISIAVYVVSILSTNSIIGKFIGRFSSLSEDVTMQSRLIYWNHTIKMFLKKPFFGQGWSAFRYEYHSFLYDLSRRAARYEYLDAHNVYLQMLAEIGVVGFSFFVLIALSVFRNSKRMLTWCNMRDDYQWMKPQMVFSLIIQAFFMIYSFTGNCLYDITAAFYFLSIGIYINSSRLKERKK